MKFSILVPVIFLSIIVSGFKCFAQVDTISVNKNNLLTDYLKEGTSQFLAYTTDGKTKAITSQSIGERTLKFGRINGRDVIIVIQYRHYNDSTVSKYVYTVSDRQNFKTLYDYTKRIKSGIEAYDYSENGVKGSDTIKNNTKADFEFSFSNNFPYCSELNVETLCALPIKHIGQKMAVNFYEPGLAYPPEYHLIEVTGTEKLNAVNNTQIDCWVIKVTYDKDNYDYFWISKNIHEFLKLESYGPTGTFNRVKLFNSVKGRF